MSTNGVLQLQVKAGFTKVDHAEETENHILLTLTGQSLESESRVPINTIIVVDVSSSMNTYQKMENVKKSINLLISHLSEKDYAALIEYSSDAQVLSESVKTDASNKQSLTKMVSRMSAGGMTTFSGAIGVAYQLANDTGAKEDCINRIIFFSDGCPTSGVTEPDRVVSMVEKGLPSGWQVTTMGYGMATDASGSPFSTGFNLTGMSGDINIDLLDKMAKVAGGNFYYMKDADTSARAFATELGGLLTTVAQDITISFGGVDDRIDVKEVLEDLTVEDKGKALEVKIPDIMSEETKYVTFKILCKKQDAIDNHRPAKIADIRVHYLDSNAGKYVDVEHSCKAVQWVESGKEDKQIDPDVGTEMSVLDAIKAQEKARLKADSGDYEGAQGCIGVAMDSLSSWRTDRGNQGAQGLRRMKRIVKTADSYRKGLDSYKTSSSELSSGRSYGGAFDDIHLTSAQASMRKDFGVNSDVVDVVDDVDDIIAPVSPPKSSTTKAKPKDEVKKTRSKKSSTLRY